VRILYKTSLLTESFSYYHAQVLPVLHKNHASVNRRVLKKHFGDDNNREFKYLLKKVTWQEVFSETEVNAKFKVFMNSVLDFFDTAFLKSSDIERNH